MDQVNVAAAVIAVSAVVQGLLQWSARRTARQSPLDAWKALTDRLVEREAAMGKEIERLHGEVMRLQAVVTELKGEVARLSPTPPDAHGGL